jgi:DNA helicase-2/ATP-dependent DNA helicase PcrA
LSICYRCPTSHLDRARAFSPTIEARPGAPAGLFEVYDEEGRCTESNAGTVGQSLSPRLFRAGDLIICRSKAPLVRATYELLKHNVPARILGKDLARGLLAYVDAVRAPTVTDLLKRVESLTAKAIQRAVDLDDDQVLAEAGDRRDVLVAVADGLADTDEWNNIDTYRDRLLELFGDGEDRARVVTLSTIHRAKGAEADRVWWLDHQKPDVGASFKREAWRKEAECLRFVAYTRARQELRLIHKL